MKQLVERPFGLQGPCEMIEQICEQAHKYEYSGIRPGHFCLGLDPGIRREAFVQYTAYSFKKNRVLKFQCGLDDYLMISFDGSLQNLKKNFGIIESAAIYSNHYENVIGMDISAISEHLGETLESEFLKRLKEVCKHACVVFFVSGERTIYEQKLLNKISECIDDVKNLTVEPYTKTDICDLVTKRLTECGIEIRNQKTFCKVLHEVITNLSITTDKDAMKVANSLVDYAVFSDSSPYIDDCCLKSLIKQRRNDIRGVK